MKKILVPFDFSENARNALKYAFGLAAASKAEVNILYVYSLFDSSPERILGQLNEKILDPSIIAWNDVDRVLKKINKGKKVKTNILIEEGIPETIITETARKGKFDLVVMGQTGNSSVQRFFVGSTTAHVLRYSVAPVMIIPKGYKPRKIKRIVFTTDLSHETLRHVNEAAAFARLYQAELTFLYVDTGSILSSDVKAIEMTEKLKKKVKYKKVNGFICEDITVREGIDYYLTRYEADMVVMVTHHYTFPQTLWKRSLTRKLSASFHIPLLAIINKNK